MPQGEETVEEIPRSLLFRYRTKPHPAISGRNSSKVFIRWRSRTIHSEGIVAAQCDDMLHNVDIGNKIWVSPRKHLHSQYTAVFSKSKPDPMGTNLELKSYEDPTQLPAGPLLWTLQRTLQRFKVLTKTVTRRILCKNILPFHLLDKKWK